MKFLGVDDKFILLDGAFLLPNTQSKTVSPTNDTQVITPDEGYIGLDTVNIEGLYAIISVSYPEGSTCTCTSSDESTIFTAKDTNGNALFNVPCNGTWTVKCYDGADYDSSEKKKSAEVEISSEGQSRSVKLTYQLMLFDGENGGDVTSVTGGLKTGTSYNGTVTVSADKVYFADKGYLVWVYTTNTLDLTNYSSLHAIVTTSKVGGLKVGLQDKNGQSFITFNSFQGEKTNQEIYADISGYDSGIPQITSMGNATTAEIYKIWLE